MSLKIAKRCQVCGNQSGKCRESDDRRLLQCMESEHPPAGFKVARNPKTKDGFWNQFTRIDEMAQLASNTLTAAERDEHYKRLLGYLTLSESDRADLERRGFTPEQIERLK